MEMIRLGSGDEARARTMFEMMAAVFDERCDRLGPSYLGRLLASPSFWAIAAVDGDEIVGGVTAHALPMTRSESEELFIYDVAVRVDRQRRGIGRALLAYLRTQAAATGITISFVPVEVEDDHAIEFYRAVGGAGEPVMFFTFES